MALYRALVKRRLAGQEFGVTAALQQLDQGGYDGRLAEKRGEHPFEDVGFQFGQANIQIITRHQFVAEGVVQRLGQTHSLIAGEARRLQAARKFQGVEGEAVHAPSMGFGAGRVKERTA